MAGNDDERGRGGECLLTLNEAAGFLRLSPRTVVAYVERVEFALLVRARLSEMEAIEAATRRPARFLGLTDVGTIETGMLADVVLLDANSLQKIDNTRKIAAP